MFCCEQERSLVILGLDGLLIVLYLLVNWHYVHEVWILFLLNYWRFIRKLLRYFGFIDLIFEDKF